jgi:hypothetical protein
MPGLLIFAEYRSAMISFGYRQSYCHLPAIIVWLAIAICQKKKELPTQSILLKWKTNHCCLQVC